VLPHADDHLHKFLGCVNVGSFSLPLMDVHLGQLGLGFSGAERVLTNRLQHRVVFELGNSKLTDHFIVKL